MYSTSSRIMPAAAGDGDGDGGGSGSESFPLCFRFNQITEATNNFAPSLIIGRGFFGTVYLGTMFIRNKHEFVAVKRSNRMSSEHRHTQFRAEVNTLPELNDPNIVSLIGYCDQEGENILVYEYANNGTIHDHLYTHHTRLSWCLRLLIAVGAAKGLSYLHRIHRSEFFVIHGDFKSSNVLLHGWGVKVSDFGLSKTCQPSEDHTYVGTEYVAGTFGHIDPIYSLTQQLRRSTDVYAFGVLLLELLSRRPALDEEQYGEGMNLAKWAKNLIKKGNLKPIIDPDISGEISAQCLEKYIYIVERCLHENIECRPTMAEVVHILESILVLQKIHNCSLQLVGGATSYGKVVDKLSFTSKRRISGISSRSLEEYMFDDLREATGKFVVNSLLGEGSSAVVFKGCVDKKPSASTEQRDKFDVAVKVFRQNRSPQQVHAQWEAEVNFHGRMVSENMVCANIINLLGYSKYKSKRLLVYEYMPNKSLNHHLFPDAPDKTEPLTLSNRIMIIKGVACGLNSLHSAGWRHFNICSQNILVSENFDAKLGGLSSVKHCPEGVVTMESDIYRFGMVFLECLTGRRAVSFSDKIQLLVEDFNADIIDANDMIDQCLKVEVLTKAVNVTSCFKLAFSCVADEPSFQDVLLELESL